MGNRRTEHRKAQRQRAKKRRAKKGRTLGLTMAKAVEGLDDGAPLLTIDQALEVVPDDLPDGAWMAMLGELTGMDAGDIAGALAAQAEGEDDGTN